MFYDRDFKGVELPPRTLCLTYDDGPGPETRELAQFLAEEGIRATFFVLGRHAEEQLDTLRLLAQCGHIVGNHTYSHPGLVSVAENGRDVVAEIAQTDALLRRHAPAPVRLLRAPYGNWRQKQPGSDEDCETSIVADILNRSERFPDYVGPINWDINAADYDHWQRGDSAQTCARAFLDKIAAVGRGIVLMHDSSEDPETRLRNRAFETTRLVVAAVKAQGYRFVGLDEVPSVRAALEQCVMMAV